MNKLVAKHDSPLQGMRLIPFIPDFPIDHFYSGYHPLADLSIPLHISFFIAKKSSKCQWQGSQQMSGEQLQQCCKQMPGEQKQQLPDGQLQQCCKQMQSDYQLEMDFHKLSHYQYGISHQQIISKFNFQTREMIFRFPFLLTVWQTSAALQAWS